MAYSSLLQERRRVLHTRIVEALEVLYPDRLAEQVERLAYHALRGEVWDRAVTYYRKAGARTMDRAAYREAIACFEHALEALQHLPEDHNTMAQGIDLRLDLCNALFPFGELGHMSDYLRKAEGLAAALADQRRQGEVARSMGQYLWWTGDSERALRAGQRALTVATALGDGAFEGRASHALGAIYYSRGDYSRAIEYTSRSMATCEGNHAV